MRIRSSMLFGIAFACAISVPARADLLEECAKPSKKVDPFCIGYRAGYKDGRAGDGVLGTYDLSRGRVEKSVIGVTRNPPGTTGIGVPGNSGMTVEGKGLSERDMKAIVDRLKSEFGNTLLLPGTVLPE